MTENKRLILDACENCVFLHQNEIDGRLYCDKKVILIPSNLKGKTCYHKEVHKVI